MNIADRNSTKVNLKEKLLIAIDFMDFGIELQRQNIKRRNPNATDEEISKKLQGWRFEAPPGITIINAADLDSL